VSKCLRCGAGAEWLQGRVPDDDTIARLEAELAAANKNIEGFETANTSSLPYEKGWQDGRDDAWQAYQAELAAARKDAARYRWLRSELDRVDPMFSVVAKAHYDRRSSDWCNFASSDVLDAAIDAAMKEPT
jgi:hypothetical protein